MRKSVLRALRILSKIPVILGCVVSLISMISPFCHTFSFGNSFVPRTFYSTYYWSFRAMQQPRRLSIDPPIIDPPVNNGAYMPHDYWFYEVGFYDIVPGPFLSKLLVATLIAQLMTLASGIASIFSSRRLLALAPLAFCSLVTVLMITTFFIISETNLALDSHLLGYWLTYPAIVLFLLSFTLSIADRKRSTTSPPTHT